ILRALEDPGFRLRCSWSRQHRQHQYHRFFLFADDLEHCGFVVLSFKIEYGKITGIAALHQNLRSWYDQNPGATVTHYLNGDQQGHLTLLLVSLILLTQPGLDARRVVFGVVAIRVFLPYVTLNMVLFLPVDAHAHPILPILPGPPPTPHTGPGVP